MQKTKPSTDCRRSFATCSIPNIGRRRHSLIPVHMSAAKSGRKEVVQHLRVDICSDESRTGRAEVLELDQRKLADVAVPLDLA